MANAADYGMEFAFASTRRGFVEFNLSTRVASIYECRSECTARANEIRACNIPTMVKHLLLCASIKILNKHLAEGS